MVSKKFRLFEKRRGQQVGSEWLTIYSDLMTNLMLFFLMLFALTRLSGEERSTAYRSLKKDFTTIEEKARFKNIIRMEKKTEEEMSELVLDIGDWTGGWAKVSSNEKYLKMRLPGPVLFDAGKAELKKEGKQVLAQIAAILRSASQEIIVEGHTDSLPVGEGSKFISNWELAGSRALAAVKYLIVQGIEPRRLSAVPYSHYRPLYTEDTKENMYRNRRIEIKIVRQG